jgi:arylsulfatase A-like enzyme
VIVEPRERPLFLFVNVMEAHAPYLPPPPHNPLTGLDRLRAPVVNHRYLGDEFVAAHNLGAFGTDVPEDDLAVLRSLYAGEIGYADRFVGALLDALESRLDRTVLAVTADHGENLGEDHRLGHALAVDERLLSVPLALAGPGTPTGLGQATSLVDLPRLLAGAARLPDHPYEERKDGVALAQYESGWNHLRRAANVERRLTPEQRGALRAPITAATDGSTLLVRGPDGDRVTGFGEGTDTLREALDAQPAGPDAPRGYTPVEEAEVEERLRELGYL